MLQQTTIIQFPPVYVLATSGDTGSAALEAVSVVEGCSIVVLLPRDRISAVQELQMTTVVADNCHVIRGLYIVILC